MKSLVLVVDDDIYNLSVAKKLLEDQYDVIAVPSAEQALKVLSKKRPDLILLDILMPGMDGFELIHHLKGQPELAPVPVIFLTANNTAEMEVKGLDAGAVDFISKPFEPKIMLSRVERSVELARLQRNLQEIIHEKTKQLEQQQYEFTKSIAEIVESRDEETGCHIQRTCNYTRLIAINLKKMGKYPDILNKGYQERIGRAAALHDLGKIRISDIILNKPGKLSPEEFDKIKLHVSYGHDMVENLLRHVEDREYYQIAIDLITFHHERWDGTGYLAGLKGEEIPLSARIMAVADVFDALISERCYKKALPVSEGLDIIKASSGKSFDPIIVDAFLKAAEDGEFSGSS